MAATRQAINHIHFLTSRTGRKIDSFHDIQAHCVDYFQNLLGNVEPPPHFLSQDIFELVNIWYSAAQSNTLGALFSPEEIRETFFSLPRNKAPGPDGYPSEFFKGCWSVVGHDALRAVAEFFSSGRV